MKKIKVMYLIPGLKLGGAEVLLWKFLRKLNRERFEAVVASFIPIGEVGESIREEGVQVVSLGIKKILNNKNKGGKVALVMRFFAVLLIEFPRLAFLIRREKPKILHSHLFHANLLGRLAGRVCDVPITISTIHNVNFGGKLREKLLRYTDRFATVTVVVSGNVGKAMLEKKVVPEEKLLIIDNGIDITEFSLEVRRSRDWIRSSLNIKENQFVFISIGRLVEQKGYPYLFEALEIVRREDPNFVLLLLGEGEDREEFEKISKQKGLHNNVYFLGKRANVRDYLTASDIFVMSSLWEGLPIALLEAMACGLPVVATRVGALPEVVEDGTSGFLTQPKDPEALAEKMILMIQMPKEQRKKMGEHAMEIVHERFSLEKMVKKYEQLYENLLSHHQV